tara:strand:- start:1156 stop:1485 length:330 start_codon:yes stop_codon:yes gene_type:complete
MSVQITHNEYIKLHAEKMVAEDKLKKETTDYTALIHKWNALVDTTKSERKKHLALVEEHRALEVKYNALVDKTRAERIAKNEEKAKMVRLQGKYDDLLKDYKLITARLD